MGIELSSKVNPVLPSENVTELQAQEKVKSQVVADQEKTIETNSHLTKERLEQILSEVEREILHVNRRLKFEINEDLERIVVKVIDRETDEVIKEIPSAELQTLISRIRETIGILFDREI